MQKISSRWMKVILWVSAYLNAIAFALVCGYVWCKPERENVKAESKRVFIVWLVFTAVNAVLTVIYKVMNLASVSTGAWRFYNVVNGIVSILNVVLFAAGALYAFFSTKPHRVVEQPDEDDEA